MTSPHSASRRNRRSGPLVTFVFALVALMGGGFWYVSQRDSHAAGVTRDRYGDLVQTVEVGQLPVFAREAGGDVAEVYRFAASDEGKILEWVPCFCGCGNIGHQHNRHCYVKSAAVDGVTFTSHGGG